MSYEYPTESPRNYEVLRPSLAKGAPSFSRYSAREAAKQEDLRVVIFMRHSSMSRWPVYILIAKLGCWEKSSLHWSLRRDFSHSNNRLVCGCRTLNLKTALT